jgi:hypothetical protein
VDVQFGLALVTIGYLVLTVIAMAVFAMARDKVKWFIFALAVLVVSMTNAPSILYYLLTGSEEFFLRFGPARILKGAAINLTFLTFWAIGFVLVARRTRPSHAGPAFRFELPVMYVMIAAIGAAYAYRYVKGFEYGYSNVLYGTDPSQAGAFGLINGIAAYMTALAAVLMLARNRLIRLYGPNHGRWAIHPAIGWGILVASLVLGLTVDMQRGDVAAPVILGALIMLDLGQVRRVAVMFAVSFVVLMLISPILDYMRHPAFGGKDLTQIAAAVDVQSVELGSLWSLDRVMLEPARKSVLVVTAAGLSQNADRDGHAGIRPYIGIPFDPIPRMLWRDKPIPLSMNDRKDGQAMAIAAREAGLFNVLWLSGGGTMYWEFWWGGVIVGGLVIGSLIAYLYSRAMTTGNTFLLLILLGNLNWGRTLTEGMDDVLLNLVSGLKLLGMFMLLNIVVRSIRELRAAQSARQLQPAPSSAAMPATS